ncbi:MULTISPECIES: hypothetical protein [Clostridia]|uniref:hypothetical protein n=1 Tax=Clostridia TaxID=186801 RepID=UPI002A74F835|nr:hypothetical protein [Zhenhengia yiwuensis]MDY3367548.1 hypothetical protein [Zhenhengia yiwuensis]MDY4948990.1 hypothetical protein [Clostridium cadaveris]
MDYIQLDRLEFMYNIEVNGDRFERVPAYIKAYFRYKSVSGRYDVECHDFMPGINDIERMIKEELGIKYPIEDEPGFCTEVKEGLEHKVSDEVREAIEVVLNL